MEEKSLLIFLTIKDLQKNTFFLLKVSGSFRNRGCSIQARLKLVLNFFYTILQVLSVCQQFKAIVAEQGCSTQADRRLWPYL